MTMKVMPVVHARTFNLDFKTGKLLVAPDAFTEDDSLLIYNIAKESTRQREMAPIFGRYVIYGNESYAVVGRTVRFLDLYTACGREPKYCHVDKENGRTAYGFVGLMIPKETKTEPFVFSDDLLLDVYEQCIEDRWNEVAGETNAYETKKMGFIDVEVKPMTPQPDYPPLLSQTVSPIILEDSDELREQIIYHAMRKALNGESISLCTSVSALDGNTFSIITCKNASFKAKEVAKAIECIEHDQVDSKQTAKKSHVQTHRGDYERPPKKDIPAVERRSEQSWDDILSATTISNEGVKPFQPCFQKKNHDNFIEKGLVLGTVLGITFIVIELACHASPILIAVTGVYTVVVGGIEAKRIIDKFKS